MPDHARPGVKLFPRPTQLLSGVALRAFGLKGGEGDRHPQDSSFTKTTTCFAKDQSESSDQGPQISFIEGISVLETTHGGVSCSKAAGGP